MRLNDGRVLPAFIGQALRGEDLTVFGDGSQTRSFCYVDDLVEGIYRLLFSDYSMPVNIGNPDEITIKEFGEEPKAKRIAQKIIAARKSAPIISCSDLAKIVRSLYPGYFKTDPATKTFQALRIFVNQELEELKSALASSVTLLKKGGRLVVVSFHSLEDQIVKSFLKKEAGLDQVFSRYQPESSKAESVKNFHVLTRSAISPTKEEVAANPRSRSSKMRVAIKL
jgi:16S rRNA (cytosine(1402)-N(4))-methyltransferase